MSRSHLSMRKIKEILRLKIEGKCSNLIIASSVGVSTSTVSECLRRAREANMGWPLPEGMDDEKLDSEEEEELRRAEALALLKKSGFYEKSGQRQKALACIERSIKLDRGRAEAWIQLGNLSSKVGGNWDTIKGYYDWVVDLKLRMIQNWVSHEDVPPQYLLWFMEELSVLKRNLHALGRAMKATRGARK